MTSSGPARRGGGAAGIRTRERRGPAHRHRGNLNSIRNNKHQIPVTFAGQEFPPFTVCKICRNAQGRGSKYIKLGDASQQAVCKISRQSLFVATLDYCQEQSESNSNVDESPACFGGRSNCWRRLSLQNFPGTTIIYAITDYA
ncbi:uncharacterized protein CXorf58 homolog [Rhynochetos jubatus]